MSMKDVIIYVVVGSFIGVVAGGLLILWIVKKCRHKSKNQEAGTLNGISTSACLVNNNHDDNNTKNDFKQSPVSTTSVSTSNSKKPLLSYGSTTRSMSNDSINMNLTTAEPIQCVVHQQKPAATHVAASSNASNNCVTAHNGHPYRRSTNSSLEYCSQPSTDSETHGSAFRSKSSSIGDVRPMIGTIRPDLYTRKGSTFMQGVNRDPVIGRMHLQLRYDFKRSDLVVVLSKARDVNSSITECYVKVFLSHEKSSSKVKQSKFVRRHLMQFEFNEEFKFPITYDELAEKSLIIQFYEHNPSAKSNKQNILLGAVNIDLQEADPSAEIEIIADIEPIKSETDSAGEIFLTLNYLPSVGRLSVTIVKAKLKTEPPSDDSEYYVKVNALLSGKLFKKKKTASVKCRDENNKKLIEWNEELSFRILESKLRETQVDVTIYHKLPHDKLEPIGTVILAIDAPSVPAKHQWKEMIKHEGAVMMWHNLQYCALTSRRYSD